MTTRMIYNFWPTRVNASSIVKGWFIASFIVLMPIVSTPSYADLIPNNTYLRCGSYLVAVEVGWVERVKNIFGESRDAKVKFDVEELVAGKLAKNINVSSEGTVYNDTIDLYRYMESYILDRLTSELKIEYTPSYNERKYLESFGSYDRDKPRYRTHSCSASTKAGLNGLVEAHNKVIGKRKF